MHMIAAMDIGQVVGRELTVVIVGLVLAWLLRPAQAESAEKAGQPVVAYPKKFKVVVVFCWVATAAFAILFGVTSKDEDLTNVYVVFGLFTALVLPLHLEVFCVRITWDEAFIHTRSPWRKARKIPFSAVRSCDYSTSMQCYRIHTFACGTIWLSPWAQGTAELLAALPCSHPGFPPAGMTRL